METRRENERAETILDGHKEFMRSYIECEERICMAAIDRFLAGKVISKENVLLISKEAVRGTGARL